MFKSCVLFVLLSLVVVFAEDHKVGLLEPFSHKPHPVHRPAPPPPAAGGDDGDAPVSRKKRAIACGVASLFTAAQITSAVAQHNLARNSSGGGDELPVTWDANLAARAQQWANQCDFSHNYLSDCQNLLVGQNAYLGTTGVSTTFPTLSVPGVVGAWAAERANWNFTTNTCKAGKVCGHWTQLAWSETTRFGCGYAKCPLAKTGTTSTIKGALLVFCDYSIAGNLATALPFVPGTACSKCSTITRRLFPTTTPGYKCVNKLCVPCSPLTDLTCTCGPADTCANGGLWNTKTCKCVCALGYYGSKCEMQCINLDGDYDCDYYRDVGFCLPGNEFFDFAMGNCAKSCGACVSA